MTVATVNLTRLINVIQSTAVRSAIRYTFDCMEVAERELARARLTKKQGQNAFRLVTPTNPLINKSIELYRAHAAELIQRVKKGHDTRPATDAELLAVFLDTSLKAPLHRNACAAVDILFARVFPKGQIEFGTPETWPGGAREEIEKARRKFRQEERR